MDTEHHKLGWVLAGILVAGAMIGSGVYLLPASLAAVGSVTILSWLAAIGGSLLLAGVFSYLAILRPGTAGLFAYIQEAFGSGTSFVIGFVYWIAYWVGAVAVALAAVGYLSVFIPAVAHPPWNTAATLVMLWLFVGVNMIGPRFVARVGGFTLLAGLVPILVIAIGGWAWFKPAVFLGSWNVSGHSAWAVVPASVVTVFWAFTGIENASVVARVVREPARNVPRATLAGLGLASLVYLMSNSAIMGILPAKTLAQSSAPFADAIGTAVGPALGALAAAAIAACALAKVCGTLGGVVLTTVECADSEGVFGHIARRTGPRTEARASARHLFWTGMLMTAVALATADPSIARQFTVVVDVSVILGVVAYLGGCLALWKFAAEAPATTKVMARTCVVGASLFCLAMAGTAELKLLVWSAGTVAATVVLYLAWRVWPRPATAV
jgi:arginine:agmatine antiporter